MQFDYHQDGQIAEKSYTHIETRKTQTERFDYNLNGQLSRTHNENSQIDFYRNQIGQLIREHQHYKIPHLEAMTAVLRYDYDELGNLIKTIRPDGQEIARLSYGSGHVYGIALNQKDMVGFKRDDLHRETERYLANGLIQSNQYNNLGLLISQTIQPEQETSDASQLNNQSQHQAQRHYHYDKNYLLTQVEDTRLGKLNYQYDPIGRLIKSQSPQHTESFSFDPAGNLIDPIATQASQIKNNLIQEYQGKRYTYDSQGNVVEAKQSEKILKLSWDNLNRLIQSDHNGQITDYGYDVFGRRLYKKSRDPQGKDSLTLFGWDGDLMVWESKTIGTDLQKNQNQGNNHNNTQNEHDYTKHYIYEPNSFVPVLQTGYRQFIQLIKTPDYTRFKTEPYSIYKDAVWKTDTRKNKAELERVAFYHCDQVGTPQTLSNEKGECIWEIELNTWGKTQQLKAQNQDQVLEQTNIRFQGQYYDEETGLHYNRYRYYEPHSGRYLSKDPIGLQGGLNNSAYVSDPNQWVDPLGLNKEQQLKSNKLISDSEDKQINNVLDKLNLPSALATAGAVKLGSTISNVGSDIYNGTKIGINGVKTGVEIAKPYLIEGASASANMVKDGASALYNGAKDVRNTINGAIISNTAKGIVKTKQVVDTTGQLMTMACVMHHGCKLPDYLYCTSSEGRKGAGYAVNLWSGQSYMTVGMDGIYVPKQIYKGMRNTAADIKKMSQLLGGQCSLGFIYNTKGAKDKATDNFLKGGAGSIGATLRNIRVGVTSAFGEDWLSLKTPKAIEVGYSRDKADIDAGASISIPLMKTPLKY